MAVWIVCPNLWGARVFEYERSGGHAGDLRFLKEYPRPKTRTKLEDFPNDQDLITDPIEDPELERRAAEEITDRVSDELNQPAHTSRFDSSEDLFDSLIICAGERLLAMLFRKLNQSARDKVIGTVQLDLYEVNESDLVHYVKDFLKPGAGSEQIVKKPKAA